MTRRHGQSPHLPGGRGERVQQRVEDGDAVNGASPVAAREPLRLELLQLPDQNGGQDA